MAYGFNDDRGQVNVLPLSGGSVTGSVAFQDVTINGNAAFEGGVTGLQTDGTFADFFLAGVLKGNLPTSISAGTFSNNSNSPFYSFGVSRIREVDMPNVSYIGSSAFYSCYSITTVSFPACTQVEQNTFCGCSSISTANFGKLKYVSSYAFYFCNKLTGSFDLNSCSSIGQYAFQYCYSLKQDITLQNCYSIGTGAFQYCSQITALSVKSGYSSSATYIYEYAFSDCHNLSTVYIGQCSYVGNLAFNMCSNLTEVTLGGVSSTFASNYIYSSAFANRSNLTTLRINGYCYYMQNSAFYGCSKLTSLYFSNISNVPSIYNGAVFGATPLSNSTYLGYYGSIYVPSSMYASFKAATYWAYYSARMVSY